MPALVVSSAGKAALGRREVVAQRHRVDDGRALDLGQGAGGVGRRGLEQVEVLLEHLGGQRAAVVEGDAVAELEGPLGEVGVGLVGGGQERRVGALGGLHDQRVVDRVHDVVAGGGGGGDAGQPAVALGLEADGDGAALLRLARRRRVLGGRGLRVPASAVSAAAAGARDEGQGGQDGGGAPRAAAPACSVDGGQGTSPCCWWTAAAASRPALVRRPPVSRWGTRLPARAVVRRAVRGAVRGGVRGSCRVRRWCACCDVACDPGA